MGPIILFLSVLTLVSNVIEAGKHDMFTGYKVHRVSVPTDDEHVIIHDLVGNFELDVWDYGIPGERDYFVMTSPDVEAAFLEELDANKIQHAVHHADVIKVLEEFDEQLANYRSSRTSRKVFEDYPEIEDVDQYLELIAALYPDLVTLVAPGVSYEGREIKYLKISTSNFTDTSKPIYFMDAMIHAREWVTTPVTLYSIYRLVENLRDEDRDLLEDIDWIILPIVNPDGYQYSRTSNRMWRKTRSINEGMAENCWGADGNRNFDVNYNTTTGVSTNPCAETYIGSGPFSEPETGYVRDIILEHLDRMQIYMNIHSHGNWVLYGFGNRTVPANSLELFHVGATMGAVMDTQKLPAATFYRVGNSALLLYYSSGSAQDYGQEVGVPFSYTLELPGYGFGFLVPPEYINHINSETWEGIAATARLSRLYYRARG